MLLSKQRREGMFQVCIHVENGRVVIDMHIQFIVHRGFGGSFRRAVLNYKKNTQPPTKHKSGFLSVCVPAGWGWLKGTGRGLGLRGRSREGSGLVLGTECGFLVFSALD